jgi:hypothetical protein
MADTPTSPRYSEQEMALILKRAAELQEGADGRGVQRTLSEITEIAGEVGIDATFVAEAVAELQRPRPRVGWLGAPTRFHDERSVPGTLSPSEIGELLDRARAELGKHGEVHQVFDGVEWHAQGALGSFILTLGPRAGKTRIALTTNRSDQAIGVATGSIGVGFLAALGGVAIAINVTDNALLASAIVAASAIAGTVVSARALWYTAAERWHKRTREIVAGLAERAMQLSNHAAEQSSSASESSTL